MEIGYPPSAAGPAPTLAEWLEQFHTYVPDAIVTGGSVTVVSGLTVRLGVTTAVLDGSVYINDSTKDLTSNPNLVAGTSRIDRLVLRRTWDVDGTITYEADIVQGVASSGTPVRPSVTQTRGAPGIFERPVALWTVTNTNAILSLTPENPDLAPLTYTSNPVSSGTWNVNSFTNPNPWPAWAPAVFTINPSRPGFAEVSLYWDISSIDSGGWGSVSFFVKANGVLLDAIIAAVEETGTRNVGRATCLKEVAMVPGFPVTITVDIQTFGAGHWKTNSLQWLVKQK